MGRRLLIASETAVRGKNRLEKSFAVQPFWGHCWAFWRVLHLEYEELTSDKNKKKKKMVFGIFGINSMVKDPRNKRTVGGEEVLGKGQWIILINSIELNLSFGFGFFHPP